MSWTTGISTDIQKYKLFRIAQPFHRAMFISGIMLYWIVSTLPETYIFVFYFTECQPATSFNSAKKIFQMQSLIVSTRSLLETAPSFSSRNYFFASASNDFLYKMFLDFFHQFV
jgi:hypothetical protein